jgi:hypothetical protein
MSNPRRIPVRLLVEEIASSAIPTAVAERIIVFLCFRREDKNPAPIRDIKYPAEIKRKSVPASLCPSPKSFSMVGIKGDRMILDRKFMEKIPVKRMLGPTWDRKDVTFLRCPLSESRLVIV